jgi:hypothetical protein
MPIIAEALRVDNPSGFIRTSFPAGIEVVSQWGSPLPRPLQAVARACNFISDQLMNSHRTERSLQAPTARANPGRIDTGSRPSPLALRRERPRSGGDRTRFQNAMALHGKHTTCALLASVLLLVSPAMAAQTAVINNITVSNNNDDLLLYASLQGAFTEKIKQAVLSGRTTSVVFMILLKQVRSFWFDDTIADIHVVHSIAYDKAKNEFVVRRSWRNSEPEITPSFEQAQMLVSRIERLKIIPLNRLAKDSQYQMQLKAEASQKILPMGLNTVLFFMSFWDVATDWYIIDFTY